MTLPQFWNALRQGKSPRDDGGPAGPRSYGSLAEMMAERRRRRIEAGGC